MRYQSAKYFDGRSEYYRNWTTGGGLKHVYLTRVEAKAEGLSRPGSRVRPYVQEEDGKIYRLTNGYFGFVK